MMDDTALRLECLRLAVQYGSARTAADPAELAGRYLEFVANGPKTPAKARVVRKANAA